MVVSNSSRIVLLSSCHPPASEEQALITLIEVHAPETSHLFRINLAVVIYHKRIQLTVHEKKELSTQCRI